MMSSPWNERFGHRLAIPRRLDSDYNPCRGGHSDETFIPAHLSFPVEHCVRCGQPILDKP